MKSIQNILQTDGIEFLDGLMNDYLVVYEKLNASTLSFRRIGDELKFYKGRDNEEITQLNETLYTYFKEGIDYLRRVSLIFYMEFPEGWMFKLQYFNPNTPGLVNYQQLPKNNLVLTCIDTGNSIIEDINVLKRWADRLQIDVDEPIFSGFLSEFQKEKLVDYANGNVDCGNIPFSQYIIGLLNPGISHSAYSDSFNTGIDSFIFKFYKAGSKKCMPLKLVDPYMEDLIQQNKDKFGANSGTENEIILANFVAWLQTIDMKDINISGETDDDRYMDLLCKLFNKYAQKEQKLFKDLKTNINESYTVDVDKIKNEETAKILKENPNMAKAFQVIVGSFMNKKDNDNDPMSIMDNSLKDMFNDEVSSIKRLTSSKDDQVKSFTELMKASIDDANKDNKDIEDDKVLSFEELMDKIGYSEENDENPKFEESNPANTETTTEINSKPEKNEDHQNEKDSTEDNDSKDKQKHENGFESHETDNHKTEHHVEDHDKKIETEKKTEEKENKKETDESENEEDSKDDSNKETEEENEESENEESDDNSKNKDNQKDDDKNEKSDESKNEESDESDNKEQKKSNELNNNEKNDDKNVKEEIDSDKSDKKDDNSDNHKNESDDSDKSDSVETHDQKQKSESHEPKEQKQEESHVDKVDFEEKEKTAPVATKSDEKPEKPEKPQKEEKQKPEPKKKEDPNNITI